MAVRIPRNRLRPGEPADPKLVNENSMPVAQELNARVNEHNVAAGTFPRTRVADKAYYDVTWAKVAADPMFKLNNGACVTTDVNCQIVPDTGEWTQVKDLQRDVSTGDDTLWVIGWVQYGLVPDTIGAIGASNYSLSVGVTGPKPRLQFGVRIDGTVVDTSLTGMIDVSWSAPRPVYPQTPKKDNVSIHTFTTPGCQSMMYHVHPVRFQAHIPVGEGNHTVELVVRRIAQDGQFNDASAPVVALFNRKHVCITIRKNAVATGSANNVGITALEDQDVLSKASIYDENQNRLAAKMNALSDGNIARHGLRHEHLPSQIAFPNQVGLTTGNSTAQVYPGFGTDRNPNGAPGQWVYVDNGAGVNLETTNGPYDFTENPCFVLILANVFVKNVAQPGAESTDQFGCFGVAGQYQSGAYFALNSSEGYVNSPNMNPTFGVVANEDVYTDVPLLEFFDYRDAPPPGGIISKWFVAATAWGDAVIPFVEWTRSNISLLAFRK